MEARAQSMRVATIVVSMCSDARRGVARDWEVDWTTERMTRVRAQEQVNVRMRQVRDVLRCWSRHS